MNFKKLFKQVGAVGGFFATLGQITAIISIGGEVPPEAFTFLLLLTGISGASSYSLLQDAKKERNLANLQQIRQLLQVISANYGKVSLAELVMKIDMPLPELKAKLDEMQKDGLLGMEVSNSGEVLYTVSNAISLEEKWDTHKLIG